MWIPVADRAIKAVDFSSLASDRVKALGCSWSLEIAIPVRFPNPGIPDLKMSGSRDPGIPEF